MSFIEILLLAVGLSMDSLAVSLTSGAVIKQLRWCNVLKIATVLALFQGGMTVIGFFAGISFNKLIVDFDHWIAFFLLLYIGGKMIYESLKHKEDDSKTNPLQLKTLCTLGIATSIDALAIGVSIAFLHAHITMEASIIAIVTFLFSSIGVIMGHHFGKKIKINVELIGGLILIGLGIKILIEHILL